jgi:protein O-mannosyl-transferase
MPRMSVRPASAPKTASMIWIAVLLAAATLAVFGRTIGAEFITADDGIYVTQNPTVQAGLTGPGFRWAFRFHDGNWIPLTWLSLMLDASLGGGGPRLFHLTNVMLHLASTLLLFTALTRMTSCAGRSGFVAFLFAVHPLHVGSVAWVAERKDVLSGLFFMLGLLAWTAYARRPATSRYLVVSGVFLLGLMAKSMLVTLPVVFLLLDLWPLRRATPLRRLIVEKLPLAAIAIVVGIVTLVAQRAGGAMSSLAAIPIPERMGNALVSYAAYLVAMVWPQHLSFFYPHPGAGLPPWQVLASAALLFAITFAGWRTIRTHPYVAIGWAWYAIMLIPVIGLIQVGVQARADRYTYLPLIGPFIAVTWLFGNTVRRREFVLGTAAVVGVLITGSAYVEAGYWHDSVTLYTRALAVTKDNSVAHGNLGLALLEAGDLDGAIAHSREALRLTPGNAEAPNHLATALTRKGLPDDAIAVYRTALAVRPSDVTLHSNLGTVLAEQGQLDAAAREFQEALRLAPGSSDAHYNLGILRARQERFDEAIVELAEAQRLSPFDAQIRESLDQARALRGRSP